MCDSQTSTACAEGPAAHAQPWKEFDVPGLYGMQAALGLLAGSKFASAYHAAAYADVCNIAPVAPCLL
jgi:hypothetical protein